jgi:hypothetical protein
MEQHTLFSSSKSLQRAGKQNINSAEKIERMCNGFKTFGNKKLQMHFELS